MGEFFEIPEDERPKKPKFKPIPPDQIWCINNCGFWVPGDGIFGKLPQESLHRLVEHHKSGCPGPAPERDPSERMRQLEQMAQRIQNLAPIEEKQPG